MDHITSSSEDLSEASDGGFCLFVYPAEHVLLGGGVLHLAGYPAQIALQHFLLASLVSYPCELFVVLETFGAEHAFEVADDHQLFLLLVLEFEHGLHHFFLRLFLFLDLSLFLELFVLLLGFSFFQFHLGLEWGGLGISDLDEGMLAFASLCCQTGFTEIEIFAAAALISDALDGVATAFATGDLMFYNRFFIFLFLGFLLSWLFLFSFFFLLFSFCLGFLFLGNLHFFGLVGGRFEFQRFLDECRAGIEDVSIFGLSFDIYFWFFRSLFFIDVDIFLTLKYDMIAIVIDVIEAEGAEFGESAFDEIDEQIECEGFFAVEQTYLVLDYDFV
jgi:hypothetical protein